VLERHAVDASFPYQSRNPAWMCGGVEVDTSQGRRIRWSEPEVVLYDDDPFIRMSYPDLIEEGGRTFVTETNKNVARVHELDQGQLEALWVQAAGGIVPAPRPVLELAARGGSKLVLPAEGRMPRLPRLVVRDSECLDYGGKDLRAGLTVEVELRLDDLQCGQIVLDGRDRFGRGLVLRTTDARTLELALSDGQTSACWDTEPGAVAPRRDHRLVIIVDGGPRIISGVLDGQLLDGGESRQFGWSRFSPHFADPNGGETLRVGVSMRGTVSLARIYDCALSTSQAVGRCR
jgi:hypothetical protein